MNAPRVVVALARVALGLVAMLALFLSMMLAPALALGGFTLLLLGWSTFAARESRRCR